MTKEEQTEINDKGNVSAKPEATRGAKSYTIWPVETSRARGATDLDQHRNNQQAAIGMDANRNIFVSFSLAPKVCGYLNPPAICGKKAPHSIFTG